MREMDIKKLWFDEILYPTVAGGSSGDESELETAVRLIRKLKQFSEDRPQTAEEKRLRTRPYRDMLYPGWTLVLEEDEHKLLLARLRDGLKRSAIAFAEDYKDLLDAVKSATEVKPPRPELVDKENVR